MSKADKDSKNQTKKQETKTQDEGGKPVKRYEEYDPCPHRVWTPKPGEQDKSAPKGFGSPWYIPVRKKVDIDKEMEEKQKEEDQKRREKSRRRQKERKEKDRKERENREENDRQKQQLAETRKARIEKVRSVRKIEESETKENKTDFSQELIWIMDFISDVDESERLKRGETAVWKKEEMEHELECALAKKAHARDFKTFIKLLMEAELRKTDKRLKQLEKEEKRQRKQAFQRMDPLSKQLMEVGSKFKYLFNAAVGKPPGFKEKGEGKASPLEDMMVSMIMNQMKV